MLSSITWGHFRIFKALLNWKEQNYSDFFPTIPLCVAIFKGFVLKAHTCVCVCTPACVYVFINSVSDSLFGILTAVSLPFNCSGFYFLAFWYHFSSHAPSSFFYPPPSPASHHEWVTKGNFKRIEFFLGQVLGSQQHWVECMEIFHVPHPPITFGPTPIINVSHQSSVFVPLGHLHWYSLITQSP